MKRGTAELSLLRSVEQTIRSVLPASWSTSIDLQSALAGSKRGHRPDALLTITAPDGTSAVVLIECKDAVSPRDVASIASQLGSYVDAVARPGTGGVGTMFAAPFISPTTRTRLHDQGVGWFDTTGNLRLALDRPAVFIDRRGADRNELRDSKDRLLKSLRGPAAARVVIELCEMSLPTGVRELAERAHVGVATSARVLELLDREATLARNEDGTVIAVHKRALVERWTQDYKVLTSNSVMTTLDPRGLDHALNGLSAVDSRIAVTGSAAVRAYLPKTTTPVSPLTTLSLYAEDPISVVDRLRLRETERGANVLLMRPYDDVVHEKARLVGGTAFAAPAQVVADLLTGPGRSGEEAEQLMMAMALDTSEPGWE